MCKGLERQLILTARMYPINTILTITAPFSFTAGIFDQWCNLQKRLIQREKDPLESILPNYLEKYYTVDQTGKSVHSQSLLPTCSFFPVSPLLASRKAFRKDSKFDVIRF